MKTIFKYGHPDRTVWYITLLTLLVCAAVAYHLATVYRNDYLTAWFIIFALSAMVLVALSSPITICVTDEQVELRSVLRSTYIKIESVVDVKTIRRREIRSLFPIWGIFGFCGYYGRFIDLRDAKLYSLFATSRRGLVAINTTRRRYIVSCRQPNKLVETIAAQRSPKRA